MFSSARLRNSPSSPARRTSLPAVRSASWRIPKSTPAACEQPREGERVALVARIEARVVADEPQHVDGLLPGVAHLEVELPRPACPLAPRLAERVAARRHGLEHVLQALVEVALLDQAAPQQVDDRHVLDADRADLDARHALHARPQRVRRDSRRRARARRRAAGRARGRAATAAARRRWPDRPRGSGRSACRRRGRSGAAGRKSANVAYPASGSAGRSRPTAGRARATPAGPASMCSAFVCGMIATNDSATMPCTHHVTWRSDSAVAGPSPAACSPLPTA